MISAARLTDKYYSNRTETEDSMKPFGDTPGLEYEIPLKKITAISKSTKTKFYSFNHIIPTRTVNPNITNFPS